MVVCTLDKYDRMASWALQKGPWLKWTRKEGFIRKKEVTTIYEKFPVDATALWKATNRRIQFEDCSSIRLEKQDKTHALVFPNSYREKTLDVNHIVARELGFVCMGVKSHLIADELVSQFSKEDIELGRESGGFLGGLLVATSVIGVVAERAEYNLRHKRELKDAWSVASAILMPINALVVMEQQKQIKNYGDIPDLFRVSDGLFSYFLDRENKKLDSSTF